MAPKKTKEESLNQLNKYVLLHDNKTSRCHVVTRDQLSFTKKDNLKTDTSALFNAAGDPSYRFKGIVLSSEPDENASDSSNELIIDESEGKGTDDNNDEESEDENEDLTCATISQQRGNAITTTNKHYPSFFPLFIHYRLHGNPWPANACSSPMNDGSGVVQSLINKQAPASGLDALCTNGSVIELNNVTV
ncbi:unnamed protein product, partial [Rotaria socialis]